ncbi:hypothetical protein C7S13_7146 [Burkholderia cepacia]|nr:hypothetical protein [Burkholderia cepacia]
MPGARTPGFTKRAAATAARFHFRVRPAVETNNRRISIPSFFSLACRKPDGIGGRARRGFAAHAVQPCAGTLCRIFASPGIH